MLARHRPVHLLLLLCSGGPTPNNVCSSCLSLPSPPMSNSSPAPPSSSPRPHNRSTRIIVINPPSSLHPDVHPPSLIRIQRALRTLSSASAISLSRLHSCDRLKISTSSPFRDAQGRFLLYGSGGGYYVGDVLGGLPHGCGQHHIPHPTTGSMHLLYDGKWFHGSKTGSASVFYTDGEEYEGDMRDNQRWGRGWMRYKDGSFYSGDWLRGRRHGIGLQVQENGNCYYGAFCKDSHDGWGTFYWISIGRKFEGEWLANQPFSGHYSKIDAEDFKSLRKLVVRFYPKSLFEQLLDKISNAKYLEMVALHLKNPISTIFNLISRLRSMRAGDPETRALFTTQVGRKENLNDEQLQLLKKTFEVITPVIDDKCQLDVVHLRRMLVLARINLDDGQGKKLLAHLEAKTMGRTKIGLDDLMLYILQYHYP